VIITNANTVKQAIANNRLESLALSKDILILLEKALTDKTITTTYILDVLRSK
jgi:hypothetical protein